MEKFLERKFNCTIFKGHKLSKPQIKLFYDDYFVTHKMLIEKKLKRIFEFHRKKF